MLKNIKNSQPDLGPPATLTVTKITLYYKPLTLNTHGIKIPKNRPGDIEPNFKDAKRMEKLSQMKNLLAHQERDLEGCYPAERSGRVEEIANLKKAIAQLEAHREVVDWVAEDLAEDVKKLFAQLQQRQSSNPHAYTKEYVAMYKSAVESLNLELIKLTLSGE